MERYAESCTQGKSDSNPASMGLQFDLGDTVGRVQLTLNQEEVKEGGIRLGEYLLRRSKWLSTNDASEKVA